MFTQGVGTEHILSFSLSLSTGYTSSWLSDLLPEIITMTNGGLSGSEPLFKAVVFDVGQQPERQEMRYRGR